MVMKGCSAFPKTPSSLGFHHRIRGGVLPLCRGTVNVFYSPSRLDNRHVKSFNLLEASTYLPTPPLGRDMTQGEFLADFLTINGKRIIGFIPFPRVLVQCEILSVSSRIWTCATVSISYDDNHYTTGTFSLRNVYVSCLLEIEKMKILIWIIITLEHNTPYLKEIYDIYIYIYEKKKNWWKP